MFSSSQISINKASAGQFMDDHNFWLKNGCQRHIPASRHIIFFYCNRKWREEP